MIQRRDSRFDSALENMYENRFNARSSFYSLSKKVERIVIAAVFLTFREDTQDENFIPTFILMITIDFKDSDSYSLSP